MSRVLRLLADAKRLRILLFLLAEQEVHVGDLCERLGQSQPSVSHHLALLRGAQLVEGRRQGKHNFYRLLPDRFEHLIDKLFCMLPVAERTLRFKRFALNYVPTNVAPDDGDASRSG
jgi:ArsR family transcriptional regulator